MFLTKISGNSQVFGKGILALRMKDSLKVKLFLRVCKLGDAEVLKNFIKRM
jgi:hypothetical protein